MWRGRGREKSLVGGGEMDMQFLVLKGANADDMSLASIDLQEGWLGSSCAKSLQYFENFELL